MGQRGRKSSADLSIVGSTEVSERPQAPGDLTPEQRVKWNALVNDYPADHFTGRIDLLKAYCRHAVEHDHLAQLIDAETNADELDVKQYGSLLRLMESQSGILARLSVRIGIGHDTGREKKAKKNKLREFQ